MRTGITLKVGRRGKDKNAPNDIQILCKDAGNKYHTLFCVIADDSMLEPTAGTMELAKELVARWNAAE